MWFKIVQRVIWRRDIQDIPTTELKFKYGLCFQFSSAVFVYLIKEALRIGLKILISCSRGKKKKNENK